MTNGNRLTSGTMRIQAPLTFATTRCCSRCSKRPQQRMICVVGCSSNHACGFPSARSWTRLRKPNAVLRPSECEPVVCFGVSRLGVFRDAAGIQTSGRLGTTMLPQCARPHVPFGLLCPPAIAVSRQLDDQQPGLLGDLRGLVVLKLSDCILTRAWLSAFQALLK